MTFATLYDAIAFNAGDTSSEYRNNIRTWMNLARSYIADRALWQFAVRPGATITTSAATTDGLYTLTGYEFIAGDTLYNETDRDNILHESYATTRMVDQTKEQFGPPTYWADAGSDGNGERQIYLWPIPAATYTITYPGYTRITDILDTDDTDSIDAFFGPIAPWSATFRAGLRYFMDDDNTEDINAIALSLQRFERQIARRKANNRLSPTAPIRMRIVNTRAAGATIGRLDPSSFNNRQAH